LPPPPHVEREEAVHVARAHRGRWSQVASGRPVPFVRGAGRDVEQDEDEKAQAEPHATS
jgi:hypothetical protein